MLDPKLEALAKEWLDARWIADDDAKRQLFTIDPAVYKSLAALLERVAGEARGKNRACEVCWNSAWVPVPPEYDAEFGETLTMANAITVRCDFCWRVGLCAQLKAQLHDCEQKRGQAIQEVMKLQKALADAQEEVEKKHGLLVNACEESKANWLRAEKAEAAVEQAREEGRKEQWEKYDELLYAVGQKFPGESRHETALRYIREREHSVDNSAAKESKP